MRQRVIIAMALALSPELVILDEPTTALDVVVQREILQQFEALKRELDFAVLFITHDLSLLVEFADRIGIMYAGEIVETAAARDLFAEAKHPYTQGLLSSFPPLTGPLVRMTGIPGMPPDLGDPPSGCRFHPRCPHCIPSDEALYTRQLAERPAAEAGRAGSLRRLPSRGARAREHGARRPAPDEALHRRRHAPVRARRRSSTRSTTSASRCGPGRSPRSSARAAAARARSRGCSRGCTTRPRAPSSTRAPTRRRRPGARRYSATARRCR